MKRIIFFLFAATIIINAQPEFSKIAGRPGAFARMGFGARSMGMGNAVSSIVTDNISPFYNPALSPFQEGNSFQTSYSFLSLDRSLNFLSFTRKFVFGGKIDSVTGKQKRKSIAGFSVGIINSGVGKIDGRDNQGMPTGELSTSENLAYLALSNRFSDKLAFGVMIRFYYYSLYEDITSTGLGFDIGALYTVNDNLTISAVLSDLNSKYKWDTTDLYGQEGNNSEDKFPVSKKIGVSWISYSYDFIVSAEFENSNAGTNYLRFGAEYNIFDNLYLRGGVDKWDIKNSDVPARPSFGFTFKHETGYGIAGIDYAFIIEPYSAYDSHIVGVNFNF